MVPLYPEREPSGFAIAAEAILAGLLELLINKQILTIPEVRGVMAGAIRGMVPGYKAPVGLLHPKPSANFSATSPSRNG